MVDSDYILADENVDVRSVFWSIDGLMLRTHHSVQLQ